MALDREGHDGRLVVSLVVGGDVWQIFEAAAQAGREPYVSCRDLVDPDRRCVLERCR